MSQPLTIDTRRLMCPLPLIRLQDAVTRLTGPCTVLLVANDPGVKEDIPMWCKMYGHTMVTIDELDDEGASEYHLTIQVNP